MSLVYDQSADFQLLGLTSTVVAELHGVKVGPTPPELQAMKDEMARSILTLSPDLEADPVLEGYRDLVRSVGRSLKKFPPAAEKLLRQVQRTGRFPTINAAVDAYNLVVAETRLALGVHDLDLVDGRVVFRLSDGEESFTPVGGSQAKRTQPGDYVYADERRVLAWLDSSDADEVKVTGSTQNIVLVIQGTRRTDEKVTLAAARRACSSIQHFCGGTFVVETLRPVSETLLQGTVLKEDARNVMLRKH